MWNSYLALLLIYVEVVRSGKDSCGGWLQFPCKNGDCTWMRYACDGDNDCGDGSDESYCNDRVHYYECSDGSSNYYHGLHCDGRIDCSDGSDETQCWRKSCVPRHGEERCFHGACITDRNLCCATREGVCVESPSDAWSQATDKTLVYADGRDLYSLNLATSISRLLHRQEKLKITALTHGADGKTIFWAAGSSIWNTTLTAEEGDGQLYGQFGITSSISTMAYDWITGNFYLAFQEPKLVVCHRRAGTTEMFCSESIKISLRQVDWLALQPKTGRMNMASFTQPGIEIVAAECDGSNSRVIYESQRGARQDFQLSADANEIFILNTEGEGTLSAVSALNGIDRRIITRNITEAHSAPLALFNEIAILRLHNETHMLMFWDNKTVVKRRRMPSIGYHSVTSTRRLFTLMDKETKLTAENRCDNRSCDQLCLLVPHDAVCACDSRYKLMEDGRTCSSRNETEASGETASSCPESHYQCSNGSCYYHALHCDGRIDCDDGSDETQCWRESCVPEHGGGRCFHGACTRDRNLCCATREGVCVKSHSNASARATDKTLVYADGRNLYSLNLADTISRLLHRQEKLKITALTHGADGNTIFWVAGSSIWNTTLTAEEGDGQLYGQFGITSSILTMAYEWTTGNFYLAFQDPKLVVCHRRAETTEMFCSESIEVAIRQVDWLALQPNTGRMYMASFTQPGIEIVAAGCDGTNSRSVSEIKRGAQQELQLSADANEILILNTEGEGTLSAVSELSCDERRITHNITEAHSAPLALFNEIAILRVHNEVHMLIFWDNKTVVTRRRIHVPSTTRLFTLMDEETQLKTEDLCDNRNCDQLCLLVPHDAVCACDSQYELMKDGRTCVSKNEVETSEKPDEKTIWVRTVSIPVPIFIAESLVVICVISYVLVGKRLYRRRNPPSGRRLSPNLENMPMTSGW